MAMSSAEWITCPECGSIFRITVPAMTKRLVICPDFYQTTYYSRYKQPGMPDLIAGTDDGRLEWGSQKLAPRTEWDCVQTTCPKQDCGQKLWVVCILV